MGQKTSNIAALVLLLLGACGKQEKTAATIAEDSALARDIAMAGMDSLAEPMMTDLSTGAAAEPPAALPADAKTPSGVADGAAPYRKPAAAVTTPSHVGSPTRGGPGTGSSRLEAPAPRSPARPPTNSRRPSTANTSTSGTTAPDPSPQAGTARVIVPPAMPPGRGTIAAGLSLPLDAGTKVCTNTNRVGQTFNATVANAVGNSNGAEIPAGAAAVVEITELTRAADEGAPVRMGFRVTSLSFGGKTYPANATATSASISRVRKRAPRQAEKIAGGAAVGAIAGQVLGKNTKSTVTGAAVGAVIGAAAGAASSSTSSDGCVPSGGRINTVLNSPIRL